MMTNNYQMYDVNINRVCEGIRAIEEYLYSIKDFKQKEYLRKIRHMLRKIFDYNEYFVTKRHNIKIPLSNNIDTKNIILSNKLYLLKNIKRIQEGLRVLEELNIENTKNKFQKTRMYFYKFEIKLWKIYYMNLISSTKVYAILDNKVSYLKDNVKTSIDLINAGCKVIQYRNKNDSEDKKIKEIKKIIDYVKDKDVLFIINDDYKLCEKLKWPFIHMGQHDLQKTNIHIVKNYIIFGISISNEKQYAYSLQFNPDYMGFGAIFPTKTKANAIIMGIDEGKKLYEKYSHKTNFVLIGGINAINIHDILKNFKNIFSIAFISALINKKTIKNNFEILYKAINGYKK